MQSTDGKNTAIFVSCGGDPFAESDKNNPTIGDGWAAIARLQIIAAQELGHFSDIKRDSNGNQIDRHSADFGATKAKDHVKKARKNDINTCIKLRKDLCSLGMQKLIDYETQLKFYNRNNITGLRVSFVKILCFFYRMKFLHKSIRNGFLFVKKFKQDVYPALMIDLMINDMKFNLAPMADVYKNSNPDVEEAIACVEALARVPQQVKKWGHLTTKIAMKELYEIYYNEVIVSLVHNYTLMTGKQYEPLLHKQRKIIDFFRWLVILKKKLVLTPVRFID